MGINADKAGTVRLLGLIGIIGVILTIASDLVLLGRPDTGYSFFELGTSSMAGIEKWRITTGTFAGVFMLPFQMAGLISLYHGLRPSGKVLPTAMLLISAHALMMGVAFHGSYAFIASGWKLFDAAGPGNKAVSGLISDFDFYWKLIIGIMVSELIISSALFILLVLKGKTLYPKWMAVFNPLCVTALMSLVILVIPSPVGGFVGPTVLNLSTLIFFVLSTALIYKKLKLQEKRHEYKLGNEAQQRTI
ncbi:MAG TPA: DUF6796 family protein [Clostridia bacterium]|nr:DUF6796 family protein [Clostridia bacterium]